MTGKDWHQREHEKWMERMARIEQWDLLLAAIKAKGAGGVFAAEKPQIYTHPPRVLREVA